MTRKISVIIFIFAFMLMCTNDAMAEIKNVTGTGEYLLTVDVESPTIAREKAAERARQNAVEAAGVFVKSYTTSENHTITQDKITIIAGSLLEIVSEDFTLKPGADNKTIAVICTVQARVQTDDIDLQRLAAEEDALEKIAEQNERIKKLEAEAEMLKQQMLPGEVLQEKLSENQRQYLIAKYERDIDVFNLGATKNIETRMAIAKRLEKLDPQNVTAFRCIMACLHLQHDSYNIKERCKKVISDSSSSWDMMVNAYVQLGDICYNERREKKEAIEYVNKALDLVKQKYTPAQIEQMVNDDSIKVKHGALSGKTNIVRELYVLKNSIEEYPPQFVSLTVFREDGMIESYETSNIKYRTDW